MSAARVIVATAEIESLIRLPLEATGARAELLGVIFVAAQSVADDVKHVGVATPGPFDYERGICTIRGVGKLDALFGVDLRSELSAVFRLDPSAIRFLNDAEAFLLGESVAGAARGRSRAIGITVGTGLGSAFLVEGQIRRVGEGIPLDGELHRVPFRGGSVEDSLSGRGLRARFGGGIGADRIAGLADAGDPRAAAVFAAFGADLGEFLVPWVRAFRAECVVVGGAVARAWTHFGGPLARTLEPNVLPAERIEDAALLGAALHAGERRP